MDDAAQDVLDEPQAPRAGIVACPFLVSAAGAWRSAEPSRDHRCSRDTRPARLDVDHQHQYCLGSAGPGCPRYVIARAPGRLTSMLPLVLDRGPLGATLDQGGLRRLAAPASVVIVGAALGAFILARGPAAPAPAPNDGATEATLGPSAPPAATPSSAPVTAAPSVSSAPTPSRTPSPTARASPSPAPVGVRTYTVRPGDALGAIAARFGTTTGALAQLNGIANPSLIRVGQVLKLP
jgi:hypothetical protein